MQRKRADLAPLRRSQRHSERLDLSLVAFFGKQKVAMGVYKGAKCRQVGNTARISTTHLFLSVWLQQHTWRICQRAHTHTGISGPRPIRGGVRPSLSLIGLDHDISLTGVSFVEFLSRGYFFSFLEWLDAPVRPGIFVSRTREKLGRTLEPWALHIWTAMIQCWTLICIIQRQDENKIYHLTFSAQTYIHINSCSSCINHIAGE